MCVCVSVCYPFVTVVSRHALAIAAQRKTRQRQRDEEELKRTGERKKGDKKPLEVVGSAGEKGRERTMGGKNAGRMISERSESSTSSLLASVCVLLRLGNFPTRKTVWLCVCVSVASATEGGEGVFHGIGDPLHTENVSHSGLILLSFFHPARPKAPAADGKWKGFST